MTHPSHADKDLDPDLAEPNIFVKPHIIPQPVKDGSTRATAPYLAAQTDICSWEMRKSPQIWLEHAILGYLAYSVLITAPTSTIMVMLNAAPAGWRQGNAESPNATTVTTEPRKRHWLEKIHSGFAKLILQLRGGASTTSTWANIKSLPLWLTLSSLQQSSLASNFHLRSSASHLMANNWVAPRLWIPWCRAWAQLRIDTSVFTRQVFPITSCLYLNYNKLFEACLFEYVMRIKARTKFLSKVWHTF